MMKKINVAILDDHQIVIDGLKLLLEKSERIKVGMEHTNGFELLKSLRDDKNSIDILLLDLMMPVMSGQECALMVRQEFPQIKIIILSMNNDGKTVSGLIEQADIRGFLPKSVNKNELIEAIENVFDGKHYFSEEILEELKLYGNRKQQKEDLKLSLRELEIIKLIAQGLTNKQIAAELFISEKTVETHRKNIFRKTSTHNVGSLLHLVKRLGILE
ncbi:MAG TPA: response regulator transcription factor [Niabella sp.]|nr:response regulator transcription factor [Niabella sp.]